MMRLKSDLAFKDHGKVDINLSLLPGNYNRWGKLTSDFSLKRRIIIEHDS